MLGLGDRDQIQKDLLSFYWVIVKAFGGLQWNELLEVGEVVSACTGKSQRHNSEYLPTE